MIPASGISRRVASALVSTIENCRTNGASRAPGSNDVSCIRSVEHVRGDEAASEDR
jgi:hypothetical protein